MTEQHNTTLFLHQLLHILNLIINFQRAKISTRVLLISAGPNEEQFEGKTPRHIYQGILVLARQCPVSLDNCNPEETGLTGLPVSWSPLYSPNLNPSDYHLFPGLKKQLKVRHFSSEAEVIAAAETRLDGRHSEFLLSGLRKLEQRARKCIELRGVCAGWIPSLVVVTFSFPGRAKDFSALPRSALV